MTLYNWYMVWQGDFEKGLSHFENKYGKPISCLVREVCNLPVEITIDQNVNKQEIWITGEFRDAKLLSSSSSIR